MPRPRRAGVLGAVPTIVGLVAVVLLAGNAWMVTAARPHVYADAGTIPANQVGLVLGTSPYTRSGERNQLFRHRIEAASALFHGGKVEHLLLSGANPDDTYNEPRKMYQALIEAGVPGDAMTFDFAGFRTLDSMIRAREVFGLDNVTVISQRYHCYRAVFLGRQRGLSTIAYAHPQQDERQSLRVEAREYLARMAALLDLFVLDTGPRFLGELRQLPPDTGLAADEKKAPTLESAPE